MRTLYVALVHSNLSYCLNIYSCTSQTNINKILLKQKEAVRIICNENYRAHTAPLFERTKILPISKLIELAKLKFMHRYVNDQLPLSFAETWITNRQRDPTNNRRNADIFFVPPYNREIFKKFPLYTFPIAWNALDDSKYNLSYQKFVKSQKERLLANLTWTDSKKNSILSMPPLYILYHNGNLSKKKKCKNVIIIWDQI